MIIDCYFSPGSKRTPEPSLGVSSNQLKGYKPVCLKHGVPKIVTFSIKAVV